MSQQPPSGRGGPPGDSPASSGPPDDGADAPSSSQGGDPARSARAAGVGDDRVFVRSNGALIAVVSIVAVLVAVGIGAVLLMHLGDGSGASGRTKPVTVPTSTAPTLPTETPTLPTETPTLPTETPTLPTETPTLPTDTLTLATDTPALQSGVPSRPTAGPRALHNPAALRAAQLFLSAAKGGRCTDAFGLADGIFKKSFQAETTCGTTVRRALTGWSASPVLSHGCRRARVRSRAGDVACRVAGRPACTLFATRAGILTK
jgi:hypothetical protein